MLNNLKQHRFNAFTIQILLSNINQEKAIRNEKSVAAKADEILLNRFENFLRLNKNNGWKDLPKFDFLTQIYKVHFNREVDDFLEFDLISEEKLNKDVFVRLKHTLFNQYNAIIGFSGVLSEADSFDETERLLIERIGFNARELFKNTKLLMEFKEFGHFDFLPKSNLINPLEFIADYFRHHPKEQEVFQILHSDTKLSEIAINCDNDYFKTSFDLFFYIVNQYPKDSNSILKVSCDENSHFEFEISYSETNVDELFFEINEYNAFFNHALDIKHYTFHSFYLFYIRAIAEKLGGTFRIAPNSKKEKTIVAEWIFPYQFAENGSYLSATKTEIQNVSKSKLDFDLIPKTIRNKIKDAFAQVEGVYILDDWKQFSLHLQQIVAKHKLSELAELTNIISEINLAVETFDIFGLQQIAAKFKAISKSD